MKRAIYIGTGPCGIESYLGYGMTGTASLWLDGKVRFYFFTSDDNGMKWFVTPDEVYFPRG
jgi:hypothetical protein